MTKEGASRFSRHKRGIIAISINPECREVDARFGLIK